MLTIIIQMLDTEESIHKPEMKSVKCQLCGEAFDTPDTLSYHKSVNMVRAQGHQLVCHKVGRLNLILTLHEDNN
jgi:hypothetical protein